MAVLLQTLFHILSIVTKLERIGLIVWTLLLPLFAFISASWVDYMCLSILMQWFAAATHRISDFFSSCSKEVNILAVRTVTLFAIRITTMIPHDDDGFCEGLECLEEVCGEFERMPIHLDQAWSWIDVLVPCQKNQLDACHNLEVSYDNIESWILSHYYYC